MRKNQPYISSSHLSPEKENGPLIDEQFLREHNNNSRRKLSSKTSSSTISRNLSDDDEHVLSSDCDETTDINSTPNRPIRPVSYPCSLNYPF